MFLALDQKRTIGGVENRNTKVDETEYMSVSENSGFSPQIIQFMTKITSCLLMCWTLKILLKISWKRHVEIYCHLTTQVLNVQLFSFLASEYKGKLILI